MHNNKRIAKERQAGLTKMQEVTYAKEIHSAKAADKNSIVGKNTLS